MTGALAGLRLHASCVSFQNRGALILGPAGAGKSALALQLLALGADLICDDRTEIFASNGNAIARCPPAITGLIEARGIGILRLASLPQTRLVLVVDLAQTETARLPPRRHVSIAGIDLDLVLGQNSPHFPAALMCYLKGQRHE